jgi:uncharacterized membrane protein
MVAIGIATLIWLGRNQVYEFLYIFFVLPLGSSYNPVNSAVYALILLVGIILLSRVLLRLKIEVDGKFVAAILPFIVLGSCLRVFQDAEIFNSSFLVSPIIYLLVFTYAFSCLLLSLIIAKKTSFDYRVPFFLFGAFPAAYFLLQLAPRIVNSYSIALTFLIGSFACSIAFLAFSGLHKLFRFESVALDLGVVFSQMLDVSATHVGVTFYGYGEQHFLIRLLAEVFGSVLAFYVLDFIVIVLVLLVLERVLKEELALLGLFRLALLVLGLAPAIRDILRVALLT